MRSYGDRELVEVRRGLIAGQEVPEQFLWRGKVWKVCEIISHWVETSAWWEQSGVAALLGTSTGHGTAPERSRGVRADLLGEREHWRVEAVFAKRSRLVATSGVFDLAFDWSDGSWRLVRCID
jgi:hypothetical protein